MSEPHGPSPNGHGQGGGRSTRPPDERARRGRLERELIAGGFAIAVVVGGGLIALLWGVPALLAALPCFGGVLVLGVLLWLILKLLELAGREPG